jgi:hypothetical protein
VRSALEFVIIRDRDAKAFLYDDIIRQLDVPCEVVKIEVAILDVNRNPNLDLAVPQLDSTGRGVRRLFHRQHSMPRTIQLVMELRPPLLEGRVL